MQNRTFISNSDLFITLRRNPTFNAVETKELSTLIINNLEK